MGQKQGQGTGQAAGQMAGQMGQTGVEMGQTRRFTAGHSRARTPLRGCPNVSHLSHGTKLGGTHGTVAVGQGQTFASLRICPSPTAAGVH